MHPDNGLRRYTGSKGPEFLPGGKGTEAPGVQIRKAVFPGEIREIFLKPLSGISKSRGGEKARARADYNGLGLAQRQAQAFNLLRAIADRFLCRIL